MKQHKESAGFKQRIEETRPFYQSLWDELDTVYGYELIDLNFANAYNIFDLLNVASIHNASHNGTVSDEALTQLRTLADKWKYGMAYNIEDSARSISGQAFAGGVLQQPDQIVSSQGKLKFSQLAGSYDAFLAFFILSNLTAVSDDFYGLPDYASTMAFELFATEDITSFPSDEASLRVRFVFQNGSTEGDVPQAYPLFASGERVTFQWCSVCQSEALFCEAYSARNDSDEANSRNGMTNTIAGVIGAIVALGVVGTIGIIIVKRRRSANMVPSARNEKGSICIQSSSM